MDIVPSLTTVHYRWLAIAWTGGIIAACSVPASSLSPIEPALSADKAIHFGLFVVFAALWMRALCPPALASSGAHLRRMSLHVLSWGTLFASGTELYQHVLPLQRMGDPYDALADACGLLVAVLAYAVLVGRSPLSSRFHRAN